MKSPVSDLQESTSLDARLQAELRRAHEMCHNLQAAAIATDEGLALRASGSELPDVACATAAFLLNWLNTHLEMPRAADAREVMIWTNSGPCYIARIASLPYVITLFFRRPDACCGVAPRRRPCFKPPRSCAHPADRTLRRARQRMLNQPPIVFGVIHVRRTVRSIARSKALHSGVLGFDERDQGARWCELDAGGTIGPLLAESERLEHSASLRLLTADC